VIKLIVDFCHPKVVSGGRRGKHVEGLLLFLQAFLLLHHCQVLQAIVHDVPPQEKHAAEGVSEEGRNRKEDALNVDSF
jgi:hypothetical protein